MPLVGPATNFNFPGLAWLGRCVLVGSPTFDAFSSVWLLSSMGGLGGLVVVEGLVGFADWVSHCCPLGGLFFASSGVQTFEMFIFCLHWILHAWTVAPSGVSVCSA